MTQCGELLPSSKVMVKKSCDQKGVSTVLINLRVFTRNTFAIYNKNLMSLTQPNLPFLCTDTNIQKGLIKKNDMTSVAGQTKMATAEGVNL